VHALVRILFAQPLPIDTGIFNEDRYFDVFVEYAKASRADLLIEISVSNRGPDASVIHVLPTLWFRNIWTWWPEEPRPYMKDAFERIGSTPSPRRPFHSGPISCIAKELGACCLPTGVPCQPPIKHLRQG
jgi:hypothetical protein